MLHKFFLGRQLLQKTARVYCERNANSFISLIAQPKIIFKFNQQATPVGIVKYNKLNAQAISAHRIYFYEEAFTVLQAFCADTFINRGVFNIVQKNKQSAIANAPAPRI